MKEIQLKEETCDECVLAAMASLLICLAVVVGGVEAKSC